MMEPKIDRQEPAAPATIVNAYSAAVDADPTLTTDTFALLRRRVTQAMSHKRDSKHYITEKMRLRAVDVEALLWQAEKLHMLQGEIRRMVSERGGDFSDISTEVVQALRDRDLLEKAERAGLRIEPVLIDVPETPNIRATQRVVGWFARGVGYFPHLTDRPHRTLREAIIHAFLPVEPL